MRTHKARQGMKIVGLLFVLSLTVPVRAQLGNEGSIEGIVTDSSGAVIPGVTLRVANLSTSDTFNTSTNELGLFRFPVLPVGSYELVAEHPGFASLIQKNVVVNIGFRCGGESRCNPAAEAISITAAESPSINPNVASIFISGSGPVTRRDSGRTHP